MKFRKKVLRQPQRSYEAKLNTNRIEQIMEAHSSNQNLFFRLIQSQRNQKVKSTSQIDYMSKTWECAKVIEGWAQYFEELAKPKDHPNFDNNHMLATDLKVELIEQLEFHNTQQKSTQHLQLYKSNIIKVIKTLKNKKAPDKYDFSAEHLKNAQVGISQPLAKIMNDI